MASLVEIAKGLRLPDGSIVRMRSRVVRFPGQTYGNVQAKRRGELVGNLALRPSGEVSNVGVRRDLQRKGIATDMWRTAEKRGFNPQHSAYRSSSGDAFARSVGGKRPRMKRIDDQPEVFR
jgi:ribosomal protein S18 acetylase RimI-like enzyme